jgi:hypothetical protein
MVTELGPPMDAFVEAGIKFCAWSEIDAPTRELKTSERRKGLKVGFTIRKRAYTNS